jgi:quercetin dioxygenase-like cupin family protein
MSQGGFCAIGMFTVELRLGEYMNRMVCVFLLSAFASIPSAAADGDAGIDKLKLETLLTSRLEGISGREVIVSRVRIPPNTSLPKHWHPGEEFAYVLEGSVTLWQKGKPNLVFKKGDAAKVPLKQIHTAMTRDEGVTLLIFRVHEHGKPERVPVD